MLLPVRLAAIDLGTKWKRHAIAAGSATLRGSDGVHLADIDGDGRLDVVSPHEQSNNITVSLHPGFDQATAPWPTVVLPSPNTNFSGPEDAVFADVDGDGRKDVIVGLEGGQMVVVLFAPTNPAQLLTPSAWTRMNLNVRMRAMRVAVMYQFSWSSSLFFKNANDFTKLINETGTLPGWESTVSE